MPILRNRTQENFTMIRNEVLRDKELSMKDRGLMCTLCSLPDNWKFSISGMAATVPDGKDAIRSSLEALEAKGYIKRTFTKNARGQFETILELMPEKEDSNKLVDKSVSDNPTRLSQSGSSVTEEAREYKKENPKNQIKNENETSTTTENVVADASQRNVPDNIRNLFVGLTVSDDIIFRVYNIVAGDEKACREVVNIVKSYRGKVENVPGLLISAAKEGYKKQGKEPAENFGSKTAKYDFAALQKFINEN